MNIFLHELKDNRKSTIIWTLSLVAVVVLFMALFPSIAKDSEAFKKVLENYPESLRKAIGMSLDSITSLLGFYSYVFTYVVLCGAIQAMNLGVSMLSKETREKTADFLLTKPVTRTQIVTAKLLAAVVSLILSNLVVIMAALVAAQAVSERSFDTKAFLLISLTAFFVECMFLALGILISVLVPKIKSVLPLSLGTVFGFFILNMFGSVIGDKAVRYLTPFKYYDPGYISKHQTYEIRFIVIEVIFIIVAVTASYFIYAKKDIHAV
ncbi:ABC transporter permease subunit [Neobacillus sp. OS1-32]|uniref:ABC transporter permease subunit n=1 Tax=Neobacillus paridis TaxID=2803862 RepID=A0ABS1TR54_9BACI|nr:MULTISPECIES: ABC transporter permease subunit [Neobacillus]MBL4953234.1 ABC transporter permease subunit [Neobacillus paridis]WML29683.1 ABC transporter permease subunit [Neobacillus sp. OS1-32]